MTARKFDARREYVAQAVDEPEGQFVGVVRNRWWLVDEHGRGYFYGRSPLCNPSRVLAERFLPKIPIPGARIDFKEVAFVPHNCRDYHHD